MLRRSLLALAVLLAACGSDTDESADDGATTTGHAVAAEQSFPDVDEVIVEGRDLANGWGGATYRVTLDRTGTGG